MLILAVQLPDAAGGRRRPAPSAPGSQGEDLFPLYHLRFRDQGIRCGKLKNQEPSLPRAWIGSSLGRSQMSNGKMALDLGFAGQER